MDGMLPRHDAADRQDGAPRQKSRGRRAPRRITPAYLERAALFYLERYATSISNFRAVMRRKVDRSCRHHGPAQDEAMVLVDELVERYVAAGLLDDRAYATARALQLFRRGCSARLIRARLIEKGIAEADIAAALDRLSDEAAEPDYTAAVAYARRRRLGPFGDPARRADRREKDLAALARAGFSYDVARRVLELDGHRPDSA